MEPIKASQIIENIRSLAKQYPDAVYESGISCQYLKGKVLNGPEKEGCIVGQAITMIDENAYKEALIQPKIFLDLCREKFIPVEGSEDEIRWIGLVQNEQDCRNTWSYAVESTDEFYKLLGWFKSDNDHQLSTDNQ